MLKVQLLNYDLKVIELVRSDEGRERQKNANLIDNKHWYFKKK